MALFYILKISFKMLGLREDSSILVSASAIFVYTCDNAQYRGR